MFFNLSLIRSLLCDERGSISVLATTAMAVSVGLAAVSVDTGFLFLRKRQLQAATDLAAIAGAGSPSAPRDAALRTLAANGFDASALISLETGDYTADSTVAPPSRFRPSSPGSGAVRLRTAIRAPVFFAPALALLFPSAGSGGGAPATKSDQTSVAASAAGAAATSGAGASGSSRSTVAVGATAVAMKTNLASFTIGSRLLGLNGGVVNAMLGGLLGGAVSLSVMDYQSLADANVDVLRMSQALATRLSLKAVTYDQVAALSVRPADVLAAAASVAPASVSVALQTLAAAAGVNGSIKLATLISFGGYGGLDVSATAPIALAANVLGLVSGVAQISSGRRQIDLDLGAQVPSLLGLRLSLVVGERPVSSRIAAVGASASSVYTAQTRVRLVATIGGGALGANLTLPVYVDIAMGSARLAAIQCGASGSAGASVQLAVTLGVLNAAIASVSDSAFGDFTQTPVFAPAPIAVLPGSLTVSARAQAQMADTKSTLVSYSAAEISAATRKTTSVSTYLSSLTGSLLGDLSLSATLAGLSVSTGSLGPAIGAALTPAAAPLDAALFSVLSTLGIGLGQADTWVSGVSCGASALVN